MNSSWNPSFLQKKATSGLHAVSFFFSLFFLTGPLPAAGIDLHALDLMIAQQPSLPKYVEAQYSPLGRSPVVDAVLGDPFYLPCYGETVSQQLKRASQTESLYCVSTTSFLAGGIPSLDSIPPPLQPAARAAFIHTFGKENGRKLAQFWQRFRDVYRQSKEILSVLTEPEKQWLRDHYDSFFFGASEREQYDFFTSDSPLPLQFFSLASRIDLAALADCSRQLASLVDEIYRDRCSLASIELLEDFVWQEEGMTFIVSCRSHDTFRESADFFLHLGEGGIFHTNAGGTEGVRSAALHVGLHGGNQYLGGKFVQGSGVLGVGVLANFEGNNSYEAQAYSQGAGFFGSGLLMAFGGNQSYSVAFGGQSFALFGSSLLWNKGGNNIFFAKEGMAQAASSTLGVAFLLEEGGSNIFLAGELESKCSDRSLGIGQGGSVGVRNCPWEGRPSFYGGVSFLYVCGNGNLFQIPWFGQGSGYVLSAGILVHEGDGSRFAARVDSQGQGLHLSAGLLLSKGGNNWFDGGWGSLGVAGDRSTGMAIHTKGGNIFQGTVQSVGTARKEPSLGVFIGLGGNNSYSFAGLSNANIQLPAAPYRWPSALFLSLGKRSVYPQGVDGMLRCQGCRWGVGDHAIGVDQAAEGIDLAPLVFRRFHEAPTIPFPFDPLQGWETNNAYRPLPSEGSPEELVAEIAQSGYERRRALYESLDLLQFQHPELFIDRLPLLENPASAPEDQWNYALLWALQGRFKMALEPLAEALQGQTIASSYARKMTMRLLSKKQPRKWAPLFAELMRCDPSEENRVYAALLLAEIDSPEALCLLEPALRSPSESMRYAAARGLRDHKTPGVLAAVHSLFCDPSFYVRRAAAMTAISLRDQEAIPVLLATLQYPTLDTTENYGNNIYEELAGYAGVNFGVNPDAWMRWWEEVHETFVFPEKKTKSFLAEGDDANESIPRNFIVPLILKQFFSFEALQFSPAENSRS